MELNCNGECVFDVDDYHMCDGQCQSTSQPCNDICPPHRHLNCNGKCVFNVDVYICDGQCQNTSQPCNGICPPGMKLNCDSECREYTAFYQCGTKCQDVKIPCNKTCPDEMYYDCQDDKCEYYGQSKWLCGSDCQPVNQPCNGRCPEGKILCDGMCFLLDEERWQCGNKCISHEEPCNGKCVLETLWKCPNANKCIYSTDICDFYIDDRDNCPNEQPRKICENLHLYNLSLNCEKSGHLTCKGHREQCIEAEHVCDGSLHCMDRSDESNCLQKKEELDYSIFMPCISKTRKEGFKCDKNNCVPLNHWCSGEELPDLSPICPQLMSTLNDDALCRNKTFWENKSCNYDKRCKGNYPGECHDKDIYWDPSEKKEEKSFSFVERLNCKDQSNLVCNKYRYNNGICLKHFMYMCKDNATCIHKNLICDGYSNCPDSSDEIEEECKKCPRTFGFPIDKLKFATFPCKHMYTSKFICSVPCDGKNDFCLNNEDENCQEDTLNIIGVAVFILLVVTITIGEIILTKLKINEERTVVLEISKMKHLTELLNSSRLFKNKNNFRDFKTIHNANDYSSTTSLLMSYLTINKKSDSIKFVNNLIELETMYHKGNQQDIHLCLKENLSTNPNLNLFYGLLGTTSFIDLKHFKFKILFQQSNVIKTQTHLFFLAKHGSTGLIKTIFYFVDLVKDMIIIFLYVKYVPLSHTDFTSFAVQVLVLLCVSISLPVLVNHILILFDNPSKHTKIVKLLLQIFASISPAISVYVHTRLLWRQSLIRIMENQQVLLKDGPGFLEFHRLHMGIEKQKQAWLQFLSNLRSNESATEHLIQAIFMIILILLKFSDTNTVTGFEEFFAGREVTFLSLYVLWSHLSIVLGYVNAIPIQKGHFMPMIGKLLIALFSFTSLFGRVSAVIVYFSPSLGLMNLLMHWRMGNKVVVGVIETLDGDEKLIYDVNVDGNPIYFEDMWNTINCITELTILDLETYYKIFLGFVILHFLAILIVKVVYADGFCNDEKLHMKFFHTLSQVC